MENRNLRKANEELKQEIMSLKKKNQEIDLLSDRDRTISENLDLKEKIEEMAKEIQNLKAEKQKFQEKMIHLKESNEIVSQVNFSLEERFTKEKNELLKEIKTLNSEKKQIIRRLESKDKEISEIKENIMKSGHKESEDFTKLLLMHKEFTAGFEKYYNNYKKN